MTGPIAPAGLLIERDDRAWIGREVKGPDATWCTLLRFTRLAYRIQPRLRWMDHEKRGVLDPTPTPTCTEGAIGFVKIEGVDSLLIGGGIAANYQQRQAPSVHLQLTDIRTLMETKLPWDFKTGLNGPVLRNHHSLQKWC